MLFTNDYHKYSKTHCGTGGGGLRPSIHVHDNGALSCLNVVALANRLSYNKYKSTKTSPQYELYIPSKMPLNSFLCRYMQSLSLFKTERKLHQPAKKQIEIMAH